MSDQVAKRPRMDGERGNEVQRTSTSPKRPICNLSTQLFSEVVEMETFVDKTMFIKAFLEAPDSVIVALAPRRFGKSTNMDMLKEFLTGNKQLFEDNQLKIFKEENIFFDNNCQKNPVIHVDFKRIRGLTMDAVLYSLQELIFDAFNEHQYLIEVVEGKYSWSNEKLNETGTIERFEKYWKQSKRLNECDVINGLEHLSHCLNLYHKKRVYVLIDEYDHPIMQYIMNTESSEKVLKQTIKIIGYLMSQLCKGNKHIEKGLINACVRVSQVLSGDANNIQYYEFLSRPAFSPYFGFTDKEVDSLLERDEFAAFKDDRVKEWYSGYTVLHTADYVIYSTYSILNYLRKSKEMNKPKFGNYWIDSGSITNIKGLFAKPEIQSFIKSLINEEELEINTIAKYSSEDIIKLQQMVHQTLATIDDSEAYLFLQFLTENGYLNVESTEDETNRSTIRAPNREIRVMLGEKIYNAGVLKVKYRLFSENISSYVSALEALLKQERDKNAFTKFAKAVSELFDGATMPESEAEFHSILFTLAYNFNKFKVRSELSVQRVKPSGRRGRLDILVILNNVGMILELKFQAQSSEEAYAQIIDRKYETAFVDHKVVTEKILLGIHMTNERKVSLTYTVGSLSKETVTSDDSLQAY